MRPSTLNPLFAPVSTLAGVGPKVEQAMGRLLGTPTGQAPRVIDLLFHLPSGVLDRRLRPTLAEAPRGVLVMLDVLVERHRPPGGRGPHRVICSDATGTVTLVFFSANAAWIERSLPVGERRWISGRLELFDGMLQMAHPDRIVDEAGLAALPLVEPVYPMVEGIGGRMLQKAIADGLSRVPALPEWQEPAWLRARAWPGFREALQAAHRPDTPEAIGPESPARQRLAFDELLASQLALGLMRASLRRQPGRSSTGDGRIAGLIEAALPFSLTGSQSRALQEIRGDLASGMRMLRLLQGDVGSGKTVVALLAMATAVEAGRQAALMAPTEILARQHLETIAPLAEAAGLRVALLTGRDRSAARTRTLEALAAGEIDILLGTHAVFQEGVAFRDLALAVVDEQHRFGVHQRLALSAKGEAVDMLVMTATPIPRTLVMTAFGDMDGSALTEKPAGRKPIDTRLVSTERMGELVAGLGRMMAAGAQVYWVCPLVAESEQTDLAAAEERFADLQKHFGEVVGLVHGQMRGPDKDAAMARFQAGETRLLVATTVIEVGVNVPSATVMVIEHAERFGLAQLHQLRGRVGRGSERSTCILLYRGPLGEVAKRRLAIMRETEDGFRIAEEDLSLRGEGDVLGTRQSGLPGFKLAQLEVHGALLPAARDDARLVLGRDRELTGARGAALQTLLYLMERDDAVRLIQAG